jgi:hypothetical protein
VRLARLWAVALLLTLAFASAGASGARAPAALTASPARVELAGAGSAVVHVMNRGDERAVVDATRAGFALDLRGRPEIVAARHAGRSARSWLRLRPRTLVLQPGASRALTVAVTPPRAASPGDHDALVVLTTRPRARNRVAVRMRMGVLVVVRVPGRLVHRLQLRGLRVVDRRLAHILELIVLNRGNVIESFARRRAVLSLHRSGRRIARLTAEPRTLRPGTRGVLRFRYRGTASGPALARVDVTSESGRVLRRTLRIRL